MKSEPVGGIRTIAYLGKCTLLFCVKISAMQKFIMKTYVCFAFLFVGSTFAQVTLLGKCPKVSVKSDFDVQQYLGRWFENRKYYAVFQTGLKCVTATYTANDNGTVNVINDGIYPLVGTGPSIQGLAYPKTSEKAKLTVIFPSLPVQVEGSYWILDTDYTSYAVVWSCSDVGLASARFSWILTRERNPSDDVLKKAYQVLDKYKINKRLFLKTDQNGCPES